MNASEPMVLRYSLSMRILHWLMALCIIGLLIVGLIMTGMPKGDPTRGLLYSLHKSFGVTVIMLAVLRLALRIKQGVPPLPGVIPASERLGAHLGHYSLYALMFLMPLSGYLLTNSFGMSVHWFGIELPRFFSPDRARGELAANFHYYAAYTLMGIIALHILGVIWHYLRQRQNLFKRMM